MPPSEESPEVKNLVERRNELLRLQEAMAAKLKARPHDYGIKAWWGFVIIGILVGWIQAATIGSILRYAIAFWIAGMCFAVFALDSAEAESKIAIVLNKLGARRLAAWLYQRALR